MLRIPAEDRESPSPPAALSAFCKVTFLAIEEKGSRDLVPGQDHIQPVVDSITHLDEKGGKAGAVLESE